jgi:hypothetical protein
MKREAPPTLVVVLAVILGSQTSCNLSSRRDGVVGAGSGTTGPTGGDGRVPRAVPISGGTLLVATDGRAWVSDPDRDRVVVADLETGDVEREHELEEGAWPGKAAADGEGNVYVVLRGAGQVQRFDRTGDAQAPFEVCANPRGVAWSAEREALLVACVEGELVVSTAEGAILERRFVAHDLRDVVVTPAGAVWVSTFRSAELMRLDAELEIVERPSPAAGVDGAGNVLTPHVLWDLTVGTGGELIALHQRATTRELPVEPPETRSPPSSPPSYGGTATETLPVVDSVVTTVGDDITQRPLDSAEVLSVDADVDPLSGDLIVVSSGTGTVSLRRAGALVGEHRPSAQPIAAAFFEGDVVIQTREPSELVIWSPSGQVQTVELGGRDVEDAAHEIFHTALNGTSVTGISCASCHPEGRDDGHTWSFEGIGARRTQTLLGDVRSSKPFHWDGDISSMGELMNIVFSDRMGNRELSSAETRDFERWLGGLSSLRSTEVDAASSAAGRAAFEKAGCDSCHEGPRFSDESQHDVGTGKAFQTPALVGLRFRGPFMHDGCAPQIEDRFDESCGGEGHGQVSALDTQERSDLVRFLESL